MQNIAYKLVEKSTTHVLFSVIFSRKNGAVYEIMRKNMVPTDRPQRTTYYGAYTCMLEV